MSIDWDQLEPKHKIIMEPKTNNFYLKNGYGISVNNSPPVLIEMDIFNSDSMYSTLGLAKIHLVLLGTVVSKDEFDTCVDMTV